MTAPWYEWSMWHTLHAQCTNPHCHPEHAALRRSQPSLRASDRRCQGYFATRFMAAGRPSQTFGSGRMETVARKERSWIARTELCC